MSTRLLTSIVGTGFLVAFLHAALPTHWLPFVLTGRGRGWDRRKTLAITALAGTGHVLGTTVLGLLIVLVGFQVERLTGGYFPFIAGGLLIAMGVVSIVRSRAAHHHGPRPSHGRQSDRAAVAGLFALMTFSPCESFLPVYLSAAAYGWSVFALLSAVLAGATVTGMLLFTSLSLFGYERLRLGRLERYEGLVLGGLLCVLGCIVMIVDV